MLVEAGAGRGSFALSITTDAVAGRISLPKPTVPKGLRFVGLREGTYLEIRRGSKVGMLVSKGHEQTLYGSARSPVIGESLVHVLLGGPIIAGLARCNREDIDSAWRALKDAARPRIHVFLATSDIHLQYKLKISRQQCLEQARDSVRNS